MIRRLLAFLNLRARIRARNAARQAAIDAAYDSSVQCLATIMRYDATKANVDRTMAKVAEKQRRERFRVFTSKRLR